VLGALGSLFLLWSITAGLLIEAVNRLLHPRHINGKLMTALAALAVANNFLIFWVLGGDHHHGPIGHSHGALLFFLFLFSFLRLLQSVQVLPL
jgi:solute carrier family 30 (zinc transporter), member 2